MKKLSWNKILNISLIIAALLVLGSFLTTAFYKRPTQPAQAEALVEGVPFRIGVMQRTASSVNNGNFSYTNEEAFYTGELETINDGDYVMLYNYNSENSLKTSGSLSQIKNVYISFGQQNEEYFITYLRVFAYLNGNLISTNSIQEYNAAESLPSNIELAYFWYDYFDAKPLTNDKSVTGEGLYEFQFEYAYVKDGQNYTGNIYNFSFYLLDQSKYETYPEFENTNEGNLDSTNIKQFYYNYTNPNLPYLYFDAARYNFSYIREKNKDSEEVTTTFTTDATTGFGTLTLTKTINSVTTTETIDEIVPNASGEYFTRVYFDELGTYNFTIKYLLQLTTNDSTEFRVIENILAYDVSENYVDATLGQVNKYEQGLVQKGKLKLHMFGIKVMFSKDGGTELKHKEGNTVITQADVTSTLYGLTNSYYNFTHGFKNADTLVTDPTQTPMTTVANPLKTFTNYPITNLDPLSFDYYSTFSYNGNQPLSTYKIYSDANFSQLLETGYITKDTNLDKTGYYEVIIKYTYDLYTESGLNSTAGSQIEHSQAFIFKIDNSTPEVEMFKTTEQSAENLLKNNSFVNTAVSASWVDGTYFQAPVTASYFQYDFNGGLISTGTYTKGEVIGNGSDGKYIIRLFYSYATDVYVETSFTVDTTPISNILIQPIEQRKDINGNTTGYGLVTDTKTVDFKNSNIINQPFTLTYSQKESGAPITTTYYKIPYAYNPATGTQTTFGGKLIIESEYVIDPDNMSSGNYSLDFASISSGIVSTENAFDENNSYIYVFNMEDKAGNTATKYIIYDLSKPYVIVDAKASTPEIDEISNPYGIVNTQATITWGDYKAVRVDTVVQNENITNKTLQDVIKTDTELFKLIDNDYYLLVPITQFYATQKQNNINLAGTTFVNQVTLYPSEPAGATQIQKFFAGDDKTYNYVVTDASHITSSTNIANSNIKSDFVRMFLDNAMGIAYGYYADSPVNNSFQGYEDMLGETSSAKQLRFTYLPGTQGDEYYVKTLTYSFYDFDTKSYSTVDSEMLSGNSYLTDYNANIVNGVPYPAYPFSKSATISNKSIALSTLEVAGDTDRVVTEILNPVSGSNNAIYSKPGMYVIRREYENSGNADDYKEDSLIRYYTFYVDRNGIIEIDSSIEDVHTYQTVRSDMLYETGSGIVFNFSNPDNNGQYTTYYTALQIQQFLAYASSTIFDSNKLPVTFYLPLDKYNSETTIKQATDGLDDLSYLNNTSSANAYSFGLKYMITYSVNGKDTIIFDNTGLELKYNTNYVTITNPNGYKSLEFKREGQYYVNLYDSSDNRSSQARDESRVSIESQYNNRYSFNFIITHESPTGEYVSKYNDANRTDQLLTITSDTPSNLTFSSLNNDSLRFRFRKNDDKYRAEINPSAVIVSKTVGNSTSVVFNGGENSEILRFVPDTIDTATQTPSSTGYYVLTIFDEQDFLNNGKAYLGGTGNNRDYLRSKTQNITYTISLQYIGSNNDYIIQLEDGTVVNYFTRTFTITLDRIKPQFNYSSLIALDNQKFAASSSLSAERMESYFFAVNDSFSFIQNKQMGGVLDSTTLFVRHLSGKNATCDFPAYYRTYTPDDDEFYNDTSADTSNHIRFSESNSSFEQIGYGGLEGDPISASQAFRYGQGYYEVVERDQAGNYKVYAIYYNPDSNRNILNYSYNPALLTNVDSVSEQLPFDADHQTHSTVEILGTDLRFTTIDNLGTYKNDYFYKCIITYGGTKKTITNNPNDRNDSNNWAYFLDLINDELEFTKVETQAGYKVVLTFINRVGENLVMTYRVPGEPLKLVFSDVTTNQFTATIPSDTDSTYIKEFHAWKFTNGVWVEQSQDTLGNTIVKSYSTGASLQGRTYTFGLGEFKFQLVDVFGRKSEEYKGLGVNDVNKVIYNANATVYDADVKANVTHTANNVTLQYQTNLYLFEVYQYFADTKKFEKINEVDFANYGITEQSITNGVRTLIFQNAEKDTIKQFKVVLTVEKLKNSENYIPTTYHFAINKTLPEIILRNISGGSLITSKNKNEPTIHTENFTVNWDTNDVFNASVTLVRLYTDASGKQQSETISNIPNGYEVGLSGTYSATITNILNYTDSAYTIYFKLVSGEIVVYDVVAINNGYETILRPSPITSTITVGDVQKVLYRYYAQVSYNNPQGSEKYIEIRANKNKGIEYIQLSNTEDSEDGGEGESGGEGEGEGSEPETPTLVKKVYQIYGTSNYGYERYIEIIYVNELTDEGLTFTNLTATYPTEVVGNYGSLTLDGGVVTTNVPSVTLNWNAYYLGKYNYADLRGNLIYLDYYFNDNFIRTIYTNKETVNSLTITTAGIHKFKLYDLAGNEQQFAASNELVINLVNNVLYTINGTDPINNQIFNNEVLLEITNRYLYFTDPTVTATLNGVTIIPERVGTSFYQYKFTEHGYYEITISTKITQNESVITKHCFTIINPKIALPCFSVPQNSNFKVVSVLKQNSDITHTLSSLTDLWISPATLGTGEYTVTLSQFNNALNKDVEFSFQVWINNEVPYIYSSQEFGTSTTKDITITYNPKIIYDQVGESYLSITGYGNININADSPNQILTQVLTENREYWVQIYSADNKLITSYKVTKDEPLNTTAIIIIVVSSVLAVGLIVVFIIIRRHLKFR